MHVVNVEEQINEQNIFEVKLHNLLHISLAEHAEKSKTLSKIQWSAQQKRRSWNAVDLATGGKYKP